MPIGSFAPLVIGGSLVVAGSLAVTGIVLERGSHPPAAALPSPAASPQLPPTLAQGPGIRFRGAVMGNNGAGAPILTLNAPAAVEPGDLLVAQVTVRGAHTTVITPPAGWTLIRRDDTLISVAASLYHHLAGRGEPRSSTWQFAVTPSPSASGGIVAYSGVNPAAPIDGSTGEYNCLSGCVDTPPRITGVSVSPAGAEDRLLFFGSVTTIAGVTGPAGMTPQWLSTTSDTTSYFADQALTHAGPTGGRVAISDNLRATTMGQLVALRS